MPSKLFRYAGWLTFVWAILLVYMGLNLFSLTEESKKSTQELKQVTLEVEKLRRENERLRVDNIDRNKVFIKNDAHRASRETEQEISEKNKILEKLGEANDKIREMENNLLQTSKSKSSIEFETLRRRVSNQIKEMWFYISAQLTKINKEADEATKNKLNDVLRNFRELQQITELDFDKLIKMDGAQKRRDDTAKKLTDLVQKRLHNLQNPKDCNSARKLVCSLNKGCGYGCQMHHMLYCFIVSYATKRTLIIDSSGWRYSARGWNAYFHPVSKTCEHSNGEAVEWGRGHDHHKVVHLPIVDSMFPRPKQMPLSVPKDLYQEIVKFHGHPFVWWISQFTKYLFNYQPNIKEEIRKKKKLLGFQSPIVGVQVRRTDKINLEAAFHSIEEYMYWVELYYKQLALTQTVDKKRVFIASDDASVLPEARKKYPGFEFLSDNDVSKSAGLNRRYSDESLHGVISDIEILSDTDFLVCTFSSQVCRLAYEVMNNKHTDASQRFRSLDDIYYFGGQQEHRMKAIWPHEARGRSEINLEVGDIVGIAGNHWDGQAKGLNHRQQNTGLFPAFKLEDVHDVADFPVYEDA